MVVENVKKMDKPKLSICIATKNRGNLISQTLDSIICQIEDEVEVVVLDGASTDNTCEILKSYSNRYPFIHYIREEENSGLDSGYDKAVVNSNGDYCWVMTDDDLLVPGAINRVLSKMKNNYDLIVVNIACFSTDLSKDLNQKLFRVNEDKVYKVGDSENIFVELATGLSFIGCVVIKRSLWLSKDRSPFFGTEFVHVGVIFENNFIENAILISQPFILYRSGNSAWTERSFEIWYHKWPKLIWSFSKFSINAKQKIVLREPWLRLRSLLRSRAMGEYSSILFYRFISSKTITNNNLAAYFISVIPSKMLNICYVISWSLFKRSESYTLFNLLTSPSSSIGSRALARVLGINVL